MDINAKINKRNAERLLDDLMQECKLIGYEFAQEELAKLRAENESLRQQPAVPEGMVLVPVKPIKTGDANISREHLVAIAEKCGLLGAYRTREFVDAVVGYGQVLLRDKAVQEAMYRASIAAAPKGEK